jgi:hypothetical protein
VRACSSASSASRAQTAASKPDERNNIVRQKFAAVRGRQSWQRIDMTVRSGRKTAKGGESDAIFAKSLLNSLLAGNCGRRSWILIPWPPQWSAHMPWPDARTAAASMHDKVLIVDFGSQVTQLIARRVREDGVYCEIVPFQKSGAAYEAMKPKAVILSGGPASVLDDDARLGYIIMAFPQAPWRRIPCGRRGTRRAME